MKFFQDCSTIEEIKKRYKQLALENHPDRGGDTAAMQAINTEYAFASARAIKGEKYTEAEANDQMRMSEEYRQVIEKIINLPGIIIEAVGHWIWVTGETRAVKTELKEAGLFYASKKIAWYYRSDEFKSKGGKKTLDEIRSKYGTETINQKSRFAIK